MFRAEGMTPFLSLDLAPAASAEAIIDADLASVELITEPAEAVQEQEAPPETAPKFRWRRLVAVGLCALAVAGCTDLSREKSDENNHSPGVERVLPVLPEFNKAGERDILTASNWSHVPGVTAANGKLTVARTGLATLLTSPEDEKTATPTYQANPTVVLAGPHLELAQKGSVGLSARLDNMQGPSTISFLSGPNRRFDERVEHQAGIDITVDNEVVDLTIWDGKNQKPSQTELKLDKPAGTTADIAIGQIDRQLTVVVNGQKLPAQPAVLGGQVWLGMDAVKGFDITGLKAYPIGSNEVTVKDMGKDSFAGAKPSKNGLAAIAAAHGNGGKQIGTAVDLAELLSDPKYTEYVIQNFNEIQTETLAKFQALQPEKGQFQFAELDALVAFAGEHKLEVQGHALIFGEAYPKWLYEALDGASKDEALDIMRTHIKTVVERYNGKGGHGLIKRWDVVNEPFDPDNWGELNKQNIWYKSIGESYIEEAFKAARAANPDGEFGINEWGIETDPDRKGSIHDPEYKQGVIGLLKTLPKGLVDYVGLQAHFDEDTLDDDEVMDGIYSGNLDKILKEFADLGYKVRISEASVAENGDPEAQAEVYAMLLEACMKAPNCIGFNIWGITSNEWYFTTTPEYGIGDDAPTKQGADGKIVERPAMEALREAAAA